MGKYDDIIDLPRPVSKRHPPMPMLDRAAQFAPFAALTGYEDAIEEAARSTDARIELGEDERAALNVRLRMLIEHAAGHPRLRVTYFEPDARKAGGSYATVSGRLKRVREAERAIEMEDGSSISFVSILEIGGELFDAGDLPRT